MGYVPTPQKLYELLQEAERLQAVADKAPGHFRKNVAALEAWQKFNSAQSFWYQTFPEQDWKAEYEAEKSMRHHPTI